MQLMYNIINHNMCTWHTMAARVWMQLHKRFVDVDAVLGQTTKS